MTDRHAGYIVVLAEDYAQAVARERRDVQWRRTPGTVVSV